MIPLGSYSLLNVMLEINCCKNVKQSTPSILIPIFWDAFIFLIPATIKSLKISLFFSSEVYLLHF